MHQELDQNLQNNVNPRPRQLLTVPFTQPDSGVNKTAQVAKYCLHMFHNPLWQIPHRILEWNLKQKAWVSIRLGKLTMYSVLHEFSKFYPFLYSFMTLIKFWQPHSITNGRQFTTAAAKHFNVGSIIKN